MSSASRKKPIVGVAGQLKSFLIDMAVRTMPRLFVIVLMVQLGGPELASFFNRGHYVVTAALELLDQRLGNFFLLFILIEHRRTVLRADVGPLTIFLRRIVNLEEEFGQRFVTDD